MSIPDRPHERLLDRNLPSAKNREYLADLDRAFTALLNDSTWTCARCYESANETFLHDTILLLLRHILEMADAIHVLLLSSASRPALLELRSMFEALLYIEYILETDSERRAKAYVVRSRLWSLKLAKRMLRDSEARKQFLKEVSSDPLVTRQMLESWVTEQEEIDKAESVLKSPDLKEVYDRFRAFQKTVPFYKALDGKPGTLRDLAIHLNRGGQALLQDSWSRHTHPDTVGAQLHDSGTEMEGRMRHFRDGGEISNVASVAASIVRQAMEATLGLLRPEELRRYRERYSREIAPLFAPLGETVTVRLTDRGTTIG